MLRDHGGVHCAGAGVAGGVGGAGGRGVFAAWWRTAGWEEAVTGKQSCG